MSELNTKQLLEKWAPVLDASGNGIEPIKDAYKRQVTAVLLENTEQDLAKQREQAQMISEAEVSNQTAGVAGYDPVLISMVRRAAPQMIAYDICGVQPLRQPTGLIFALRSRYGNNQSTGTEAFYDEANTAWSGAGTHGGTARSGNDAGTTNSVINLIDPDGSGTGTAGTFTSGTAVATATGEAFGQGSTQGVDQFGEMNFSVEKMTVTARTRALKASYSVELAQDLKALHGLDADTELSNILSTEILSEINREVLRTMYINAAVGAQEATLPGNYDLVTDADGRWLAERHKALLFQIEREANRIAQTTRRGKGNILVVTSDVASALAMVGKLDYAPGVGSQLQVDESSATFAGVLNGKYKVYVDPYMGTAGGVAGSVTGGNFVMVGYKGSSAWDAGMYYAPYVPLQLVKTTDPATFTPRMAYRTRYALAANPFNGIGAGATGNLNAGTSAYYRKFAVRNLA